MKDKKSLLSGSAPEVTLLLLANQCANHSVTPLVNPKLLRLTLEWLSYPFCFRTILLLTCKFNTSRLIQLIDFQPCFIEIMAQSAPTLPCGKSVEDTHAFDVPGNSL